MDRHGCVQYQSFVPSLNSVSRIFLYSLAYLSLIVIIILGSSMLIAKAADNGAYVPPLCTPGYFKTCESPNPDGTVHDVWFSATGLQTADVHPCPYGLGRGG